MIKLNDMALDMVSGGDPRWGMPEEAIDGLTNAFEMSGNEVVGEKLGIIVLPPTAE